MSQLLLVIHVLAAAGVIALVLVQHGKGADMGAAFGSGASQTLFGARGSANFLSRMTAVLAFVFFLTSMGLAYLSGHQTRPVSATERSVTSVPEPVPAPPTGVPTTPEVPK